MFLADFSIFAFSAFYTQKKWKKLIFLTFSRAKIQKSKNRKIGRKHYAARVFTVILSYQPLKSNKNRRRLILKKFWFGTPPQKRKKLKNQNFQKIEEIT